MAFKIADIFADLTVKTDNYDRGLDRAHKKASNFSSVLQGVFQGVGQRLFDGIVSGTGALIDKMGQAVTASSNLNETISKTSATFGSASASVLAWSENSAQAFGLSQRAALDVTAGLGNMFIQLGAGREQAASLSQGMVELSADIASFNNVSGGAEEVANAMSSAFRGEYDALQRYIPTITAASVEQRALAMTGKESKDSLTQLDKALATQEIIMRGAGAATGDFNKTSRELANAQRILASEMENGAAKLGGSFRPALASITSTLADIAPQMFTYAQNITDQFANGLAAGIRAIIPVIQTIRQLFTYWFKPGSPPKILPDIDVWGKGTMQAWLDGMTAVDVKAAFDTVGRAIEGILRSFVGAGKMDEGSLVSTIFGSRDAIAAAVAEFSRLGSVSESTIKRIASSAGPAGAAVSTLVKTYFELQRASEKVKQAQDALNRTTEEYDAIINPLRGALDDVRGQQQALANQQRLIAAQNTLNNFESTAAEKQAAQLEIQQIALENQLAAAEEKKDAAIEAGQAAVDTATKEEEAAKLQLDAAQAVIDNQVTTNNLIAEQLALEERLASEREAAAKKAEAAAEKAAREAEQLYQAQLSYQLGIASGEEKLAILRRELNRVPPGSVEYFQLLGQIADQEEQNAKENERNSAKLTDAQLNYNLALADTAGKIAIWQGELAKVAPGSAEYFRILTTIVGLQDQLNKGAGGLDIGPSIDTGVIAPMEELQASVGQGGKALADAVKEMGAAFTSPEFTNIPADVKRLADSVTGFVDALTELGKRLGLFKDDSIKASEETKLGVMSNIDEMAALLRMTTSLMNGDWSAAWADFKLIMDDNFDISYEKFASSWGKIRELNTLFTGGIFDDNAAWWASLVAQTIEWLGKQSTEWGLWFSERSAALGEWFAEMGTSFFDGGANMLDSFWDGLKSKWTEIETWFSTSLAGLRNQLPFSEPKDPSSPLRGLGKSGESMINMIQGGIDRASLNVNALAGNLMPAGATSTVTNSVGQVTQILNFYGDVKPEAVKAAAATGTRGVLDELRSAGVR